ncbi:MAG TPA: AGE family epimerase/isomerase [Hanamia sp.]|nr:AGE family epimerase/isomerase [Hanamia sp.]
MLQQFKEDLENELQNILDFWENKTIDDLHGGFLGQIDNDNKIIPDAPKGSVLTSRILWTFSSAYNLIKSTDYLKTAERAFGYLRDHFIDKEYGGVFWTVDYKGNPLDTKKQIYALAFAIYGLSEYYIGSKNEEALLLAIDLYDTILKYSYDLENGGYIEALTRDWKEIDDLRLSNKDANEKKSMNTHLHLLEAFANLYRVWKNEKLEEKISELIYIFLNQIIDPETHHLILFFDEKWNPRSQIVSYGHDIEASWLIEEAAKIIGNEPLLQQVKDQSNNLAIAASDGLDTDGGLWYEYDLEKDDLVKEKHSWPQAEAMVGFFNAWKNTGVDRSLNRSLDSWNFIQEHILDKKKGEWFWGIHADNTVMNEDKVGIWKCPYHNSRACMELIKRI